MLNCCFLQPGGHQGGWTSPGGHRRWQTLADTLYINRDTCSQYQYSFLIFNCDDNKSSSSPQSILRGCRWSRKNRKKHTSSPAQLHSAQLHSTAAQCREVWISAVQCRGCRGSQENCFVNAGLIAATTYRSFHSIITTSVIVTARQVPRLT